MSQGFPETVSNCLEKCLICPIAVTNDNLNLASWPDENFKKLDIIKYLDDINKEKNIGFEGMIYKSIENRASSALQVGVKWGHPSKGYLLHTCWRWLAYEIIL